MGGGKTQDAPLADDLEGAEVARHLNKRYAESVSNCSGGPRMPAFLCSGIILRAAKYSPNYHAWVPNPNDPNGDGVSFSFLRHDAKFKALAYGYQQGFIAYPVAYTPPSLIHLQVLCGFPLDAATDIRSDSGCGPSDRYPNQSGPCQAQAIFTAPQWITHYRTAVEEPHRFQCGFTLAAGTANSAAIFMEMLESMHELGEESFNVQNELIIRSWAATPNHVPIEAFFYVGGTQGLGAAQNIQRDFSQTVDAWRPVIRMNLPATSTGSVTFEYVPGEQAVR
ncbi:hypothetical protein ACQKIE_01375 [Luteibacter sp. NPDC031894]|uniref:hypothetical protein n=1 Tax=Luteibacter sp. NPDC031894 TaxID=3390572 RepID=UPI003D06C813